MRIPPIVLPAAFAASLLIVAIAPVAAQDIPTVGVMDLESFMMGEGGASVQLGKAVTAMLATEFSSREGIRIVERQRINDLIREMDLSYSGRVEEAVEIGKLLGMQYVLLGAVTSIVDNLRMDIRAVDVETSEVLTAMKKSATTNELFSVVVDLADDFGKALNLTAPSQRPEVEEIPIRATIEFSRAVTYEDEQDFGQAIEHYEATLEIHSTHRDAQLALERLREGT
ncbi:MAG: hypothetical protein OSA81_04980 [Longimicrobiales bacterium]|nr:hypothetical protein [Longimicrobiales bacterium]